MSDAPPAADYRESPLEQLVEIRLPKKKPPDGGGGPSDFRAACGAFIYGTLPGTPVGYTGVQVLDDVNMYLSTRDTTPGHDPKKPIMYFPAFTEYMSGHGTDPPSPILNHWPYIWWSPGSWTITNYPEVYGGTDDNYRFLEFRNVNLQVFDPNSYNTAPDRAVDGNTITILHQTAGEIYPPFFILEHLGSLGSPRVIYPHIKVQAHCLHETEGGGFYDPLTGLPPQPPGWGTFFDPAGFWKYPAPGSTDDPIRPPEGALASPTSDIVARRTAERQLATLIAGRNPFRQADLRELV
jgi:hypothetical protein